MAKELLRNMEINQSGTIHSIKISGELGRRLRDMGFTPQTPVTVCGRAPLKDPVAVRILGSTVTLRNNEADHIVIDLF